MQTVSSRAFNQDISQAKRLAREEPVFVTDRGRPTHVLLSIDDYRRLTGPAESLADALAMDEALAIDPDWRAAGALGRR